MVDTIKSAGAEAVAHTLLQHIADKGLHVGATLPNGQELAKELGVSRSVIREGVGYLKAIHLVEGRKRGGTKLTAPSLFAPIRLLAQYRLFGEEDVTHLRSLRLMLELGAAPLIYRRKTAADLEYLKKVFRSEDPMAVGLDEFNRSEVDFHSRLFNITGNPIAIEFREMLEVFFRLKPYRPECKPEFYIASHQDICRALEYGTLEEFTAALRGHFEAILRDTTTN